MPTEQERAAKAADQMEAKRDDRLAVERAALAAGKQPKAGMTYEVMADTFGANPTYSKGDLITAAEFPGHYDVDWALKIGAVREAPEYAGRGLESSTMPIEGQPADLSAAPPAPTEPAR